MKRIDVAMLIYNASIGNDGENTVSKTTPKPTTQSTTNTKTSSWSNWSDSLPSGIDSGSYDIETKTQYSYRKKSYIELDYTTNKYTLERVEKSYGNWSDWQDSYIAETDSVDVETREQSTPKKYHYAHYCTGKYDNPSYVYQTSNYKFCNEATYHDLGWFDSPLPYSSDSTNDYAYYVNGSIYKCSNTCYRWYLLETSGGTYTQYRSRAVKKTYIYQTYTDWSDYSDKEPSGSDIEVKKRIIYRYREK
jgi:hypothetical protein